MNKNKLWTEKYRPKTVKDYLFKDEHLKKFVERVIKEKNIPNLLFSGVQGSGKAQPLYSKVLTPNGWKMMGEIKQGDTIITPSGEHSKILEVFPQGEKDIYTITFHDGSSTECCLDHVWECYFWDECHNKKAIKHVVDTKTILRILNSNKKIKQNISIPMVSNIELLNAKNDLPVDPYLLGVLIGDGSFCYSGIKITSADPQIIKECENVLPEGYEIKPVKNTHIEYSLVNKNRKNFGGKLGTEENKIMKYLRFSKLQGKRSHEKFIPEEYKNLTISNKWKLVRGLMDTDGTIGKKSGISFSTSSYELAHDFQEILWSLGCTCTITSRIPTYTYKAEKKKGKTSFTLHMNHNSGTKQFFQLNRKKERGINTFAQNHKHGDITLRRRISSIEYKGREEAKCILIDNPEHLYITDDYIVTHNTTLAYILIRELGVNPIDILIVNGSDERKIDDMRDKIRGFTETQSLGDFKVILLEESDALTPQSQWILRKIIEPDPNSNALVDLEEANLENARFILTCNYQNKIIPSLKSRCQHFEFRKPDFDEVLEYIYNILRQERIKTNFETLEKYVTTGFPDIRKIINLVQQNSSKGKLYLGEINSSEDFYSDLFDSIGNDDWVEARKFAMESISDNEWEDLYRTIYEKLSTIGKFKDEKKWEEGVVIIAEHLYKHSLVAIPSINGVAMFIRLAQI